MAAVYRYVLEQRAAEFILALAEDEQDLTRSFLRWLAANPDRAGDANHRDSNGRLNQAHLCGPFTIVVWTDHAVCEVRVVEVMKD